MSLVVACKLPHGLLIVHNGQTIVLKGANDGVDAEMVHRNDRFALTDLDDKQAEAFLDWTVVTTYKQDKEGKPGKEQGKLAEPNAAIESGAIQWFKSRADADKEMSALAGLIVTGTEGIDPATDKEMKASGLETDGEAMAKGKR